MLPRPASLLVSFIMGISMVHAEQYPVSAVSQLATSAEIQAMPSSFSPIVFTLDGIDALGEVSPLLESRPGGSTISYLEPRVEEVWQLPDNDVHALPWTGRTADTARAVKQAKALLLLLIGIAKQEKRPVVIVAHSWGSVLAYRALIDLYGNGDIRDGDIDQLITIGSPLFEENVAVRKFARLHANWIGAAPAGLTVRQWHSFYTNHDCLGGGVSEAGVENHNLPTSETKCLKAHRAYFEDDKLLRKIGQYVTEGLQAREQTIAGRRKLLSERAPAEKPTRKTADVAGTRSPPPGGWSADVKSSSRIETFEVLGLKLGMNMNQVKRIYPQIGISRFAQYGKDIYFVGKGEIEGWKVTMNFAPRVFQSKLYDLSMRKTPKAVNYEMVFSKLRKKYGQPDCQAASRSLGDGAICWGGCRGGRDGFGREICQITRLPPIDRFRVKIYGRTITARLMDGDLYKRVNQRFRQIEEDERRKRERKTTDELKF